MKYIIIGTAGHVDHGKTALIKALTGTDTDRLKEEKQRGISIDLGFASLALDDNLMAGIVDVPGHERFLKNMLAGTGGIDMAMLVVAADEGVMPQTREHLAMLQLYGINKGVVVINKIDKVDAEWLELVTEDIKTLLAGTFLANAPCCQVSAQTGAGLPELRSELVASANGLRARESQAPFRLWVDRSFTVKGHGVVVTGSVLSGTAKVGDNLVLYPDNLAARVRGIEWHGHKVEKIQAGQRAAINLAGLDLSDVGRGMSLSTPSRGDTSNVWDIKVDWLQPVDNGTRVRLHIGTGEYLGRLYQFKDASTNYGRLVLENPLGASAGDRGILRLYSPQQLLAGIILVAPGRNKRIIGEDRLQWAEALARCELDQLIVAILRDEQQPLSAGEIMRRTGYLADDRIKEVISQLMAKGEVLELGGIYWLKSRLSEITCQLQSLLQGHHFAQPERLGMLREVLRQQLKLEEKHFEQLLALWEQQQLIDVAGAEVALVSHAAKHRDWRIEISAKAEEALVDCGLRSVDTLLLADKLKLPVQKAQIALEMLQQGGIIIKIGDMNIYHQVINKTVEFLQQHFRQKGTISVGELRDLLQTSRKIALPLMEYFDLQKITQREGDVRLPGENLY